MRRAIPLRSDAPSFLGPRFIRMESPESGFNESKTKPRVRIMNRGSRALWLVAANLLRTDHRRGFFRLEQRSSD